MKAVVAAFNQEKALVGAFSVITNLRTKLFEALPDMCSVDSEVCGDSVDMSSLSALIPTEPGTRPTLAKYCSHYSVSKY